MTTLDINIVWGGYYTSKDLETDKYGIFRLLDFNKFAYQAALFKGEFELKPTMQDVEGITTFVGHAPIDTRALFNETAIELIGRLPLSLDDLIGYRFYLEHCDVPTHEIDELMQKLRSFSSEPPLKLRMKLEGEELRFEERS